MHDNNSEFHKVFFSEVLLFQCDIVFRYTISIASAKWDKMGKKND